MDLDLWDCFGRKKIRLISEEIRYLGNVLEENELVFVLPTTNRRAAYILFLPPSAL